MGKLFRSTRTVESRSTPRRHPSAYVVFRPEDAGDLRGSTVSGMWTLATEGSVHYATDCEVITLD